VDESRGTLTVGRTLGDAWRLYRLLFQRSMVTAAAVYALIALLLLAEQASEGGAATLLGLARFVATLAGPLLVQGALVELVRNVHEGRAPERVGVLFATTRARLVRLVGAALLYGVGVVVGLVLLLVPGLIVAARWSLFAPLVVLEGRTVREARVRSSALVRGQTATVLVCLAAVLALGASVDVALLFANLEFGTFTFLSFVWSVLMAPFEAHVFTVIYYRLADPGRPVIDPVVLRWRSVWEGR